MFAAVHIELNQPSYSVKAVLPSEIYRNRGMVDRIPTDLQEGEQEVILVCSIR